MLLLIILDMNKMVNKKVDMLLGNLLKHIGSVGTLYNPLNIII